MGLIKLSLRQDKFRYPHGPILLGISSKMRSQWWQQVLSARPRKALRLLSPRDVRFEAGHG